MRFVTEPIPLRDAIAHLDARDPVAATLRTADWAQVPAALRERAFFSAGVDDARFLSLARSKLLTNLARQRETVARGEAFVDRSSFIGDMRAQVLASRGLDQRDTSDSSTDLTNLASRARLGLIFDMQTRMAEGYAERKATLANADYLPAQELLPSTARVPRPDWGKRWEDACQTAGDARALEIYQATGRIVARKDSAAWESLSSFGVPWPPFDFGSQRELGDIRRDEAEALGLVAPDEVIDMADDLGFNARLEATLSDFDPDLIPEIADLFGDKVELSEGVLRWKGAA